MKHYRNGKRLMFHTYRWADDPRPFPLLFIGRSSNLVELISFGRCFAATWPQPERTECS